MFKQREPSIDALRAFALFGILVVNLPFFAITYGFAGGVWQDATPLWANVIAAGVIQGLFESKFILIFSTLFGFAAFQQFQRYGLSFYIRRLVVLALFGLVNLTLLFEADILLPYAVIGLLLVFVRNHSVRSLLTYAIGLWAWAVIGNALFGVNMVVNPVPYVAPDIPVAEVLASGSFLDVMAIRLDSWSGFQLYCLWSNYLLVAAAMCGGLAAARYCDALGFDVLIARLRLIASFAIIPAILGSAVYGVLAALPASAEPERFFMMTLILRPLFAVLLSLVLVSLAMRAFMSKSCAGLTSFIAPAGRMSLTIYLGMSLVMGIVFFGYGAGLHNQVSLIDCLWISLAMYLGWVLFAQIWFRVASRGPLERILALLARPGSRRIEVSVSSS
ncbi:DUF418 domain-containing protein [Thalassospira australica]|uniref:DUF418 domain-containing protein n=1 Tax=Thalassospira australica TaxID=1528106 RepID=UPI00384E1854